MFSKNSSFRAKIRWDSTKLFFNTNEIEISFYHHRWNLNEDLYENELFISNSVVRNICSQ
jgi:hypothetical protein